jgi:hypothetical protein
MVVLTNGLKFEPRLAALPRACGRSSSSLAGSGRAGVPNLVGRRDRVHERADVHLDAVEVGLASS